MSRNPSGQQDSGELLVLQKQEQLYRLKRQLKDPLLSPLGFTNEETEGQRREPTYPRSHRVPGQGFAPGACISCGLCLEGELLPTSESVFSCWPYCGLVLCSFGWCPEYSSTFWATKDDGGSSHTGL